MFFLVGLGNPGQEYLSTRHNIGFEIIDSISHCFKFPSFKEKFDGLITKKTLHNHEIFLFKPMKFMNLSGNPIRKAIDFYKINPKGKLIIFHDDLDMDFSKLRIKFSGGHGGHNGIKNIIQHIGLDFVRIKIGIKSKYYTDKKVSADKFVLQKFNKEEILRIEKLQKEINSNLQFVYENNFPSFINNIKVGLL